MDLCKWSLYDHPMLYTSDTTRRDEAALQSHTPTTVGFMDTVVTGPRRGAMMNTDD